jgi:NAD(P)-dependent dehydrogenase (short-subunit alcohol dehydrogenase family)
VTVFVSEAFTIITGASSGIGRAIAMKLSSERKLILHGRSLERLEETRRLCGGSGHLLWCWDLKNAAGLSDGLAIWMEEHQVKVESFIHCAGMVTILPARSISHVIAQEILTVNFTSAMEIIAALLRKRINQQNLRNVLFISSIWSRFGARGYSLYCASKGALDSAMRALAVELAPIVRVNSLVLGAIKTPMAETGFSDPVIIANLEKQYPLGTGSTDDPADAAAFLISDQARWITGQQIFVDGGRTANMSLK